MLNRLSKPHLHKHRHSLLCVSIFLLLFLQVAEAIHQHPLEQDSNSHHCLVCQKLQHADHVTHSTFADLSVLAGTDEFIVNQPVLYFSHNRFAPRARSPPATLH